MTQPTTETVPPRDYKGLSPDFDIQRLIKQTPLLYRDRETNSLYIKHGKRYSLLTDYEARRIEQPQEESEGLTSRILEWFLPKAWPLPKRA